MYLQFIIMDISVIQIGNSKGIRLPKNIIDQYNISDTLELSLEKGFMILKPKVEPRKGWSEAFKKMHAMGDDKLLIDDVFENENFEGWS